MRQKGSGGPAGPEGENFAIARNISDCRADSNPGTDRHTRADTFGNTCRYPRADSCPYAGIHSNTDGRTCPGAGEHELWCCAL